MRSDRKSALAELTRTHALLDCAQLAAAIGGMTILPAGMSVQVIKPATNACEYCGSVVKDTRCDSCGAPIRAKMRTL